jgi:hypothetical protein
MKFEIPQPHAGGSAKAERCGEEASDFLYHPKSASRSRCASDSRLHLGGCFGIGYEVIFISSSHCVNSVSQPVNHEPVVRRKPSL